MDVGLNGRRVLVTGAAGGLGRAIARRLAECGAAVAVSDLAGDALAPVAREVAAAGAAPVATIPADLGDGGGHDLATRAADQLGGLDGLVNCAGLIRTTPLAEISLDEWQRIVAVNLTGTFAVTQAAAALMRDGDGGAIVSVASVAARSGRPDAAHYAAAKAGLLSLTKSAALAYAPTVRVNAVCPGVFLTPMWDGIMRDREQRFGGGAGERWLAETRDRVPLGRTGEPVELANAVLFLLGDLASYVTGQALNVDGGLEMD
ncbi:SDR family NAD(P)-dependent oxidoreductase [Plantactinospora sp. WMMC1484]|uniref:SDR family NAD(P)-dependent oxidoreductase n=1 Tax=Plantactinospora sp. WMMC1484 TaxID=3404122 RepID=UPI003BF521A6